MKSSKGKKKENSQIDIAAALTRKETRTIRKCQGMHQYWIARCPNYGVFESQEYKKATDLIEKIKDIEGKARKRCEVGFD